MKDDLPLARLGDKFRRILRKGRGGSLTMHDFRALAEMGVLDLLQAAETKELKARWVATPPLSSTAIIGSTNEETVGPRRSGRSPGTRLTLDRSAIAALGTGISN